jgi:serine protease Do
LVPGSLALICAAALASAQETDGVFAQFSNRVVQVRVTSKGSDTKSVIGSGFFIAADGTLITNYHVISDLLLHPDRYQIKIVEKSGAERDTQLLDVDVINDLAILKAATVPPAFFTLNAPVVQQGSRLFSLGNPHDVGMSIVEGTYNGLISESLYEQIHFTGSLNGGVSGGPSIDAAGNVVGINVSSAGDQLSQLVPVKFALALQEKVLARGGTPISSVKDRVREQLIENQERITSRLLEKPPILAVLGQWRLPGRWLAQLKEWGTQPAQEEDPWVVSSYQAASEHAVYLGRKRRAGALWLHHGFVQGKDIASLRLYALWGKTFGRTDLFTESMEADKETATNWRCQTRFVQSANQPVLQVAFCLRGLKPFDGLYDVVVRVLSFAQDNALLIAELGLGGFTGDNARLLSKRFLEGITWTP